MEIGRQRQSKMLTNNCIDSKNSLNNADTVPSTFSASQVSNSSRTCHKCEALIMPGEYYMIASNYSFHQRCFYCRVCKKEIHAGEKFHFEEAAIEFLCEYDYKDLKLPKCVTCGSPIIGEYKIYKGKAYHSNHLFCAKCKEILPDMFYEVERVPWCANCYHSLNKAANSI